MNASEITVIHWFKELEAMEKQGTLMCPALTREPGRNLSLCGCDIPKTRTAFVYEFGNCYESGSCRPRKERPEPVHAELYPPPDYKLRPTHFESPPENQTVTVKFAAIRRQRKKKLRKIRAIIKRNLKRTL